MKGEFCLMPSSIFVNHHTSLAKNHHKSWIDHDHILNCPYLSRINPYKSTNHNKNPHFSIRNPSKNHPTEIHQKSNRNPLSMVKYPCVHHVFSVFSSFFFLPRIPRIPRTSPPAARRRPGTAPRTPRRGPRGGSLGSQFLLGFFLGEWSGDFYSPYAPCMEYLPTFTP